MGHSTIGKKNQGMLKNFITLFFTESTLVLVRLSINNPTSNKWQKYLTHHTATDGEMCGSEWVRRVPTLLYHSFKSRMPINFSWVDICRVHDTWFFNSGWREGRKHAERVKRLSSHLPTVDNRIYSARSYSVMLRIKECHHDYLFNHSRIFKFHMINGCFRNSKHEE